MSQILDLSFPFGLQGLTTPAQPPEVSEMSHSGVELASFPVSVVDATQQTRAIHLRASIRV